LLRRTHWLDEGLENRDRFRLWHWYHSETSVASFTLLRLRKMSLGVFTSAEKFHLKVPGCFFITDSYSELFGCDCDREPGEVSLGSFLATVDSDFVFCDRHDVLGADLGLHELNLLFDHLGLHEGVQWYRG